MIISSIVEGEGEVQALPVLLRRMVAEFGGGAYADILKPIRVRKDRFINKGDDFKKFLLLAAAQVDGEGMVLVVLDADDDCPVELARLIHERALQVIPGTKISVVIANREYESWFIAAASSLNGYCNLLVDEDVVPTSENIRNAKLWLTERMSGSYSYKEVVDQPKLTARFDMEMAKNNSRSFRKLCSEFQGLFPVEL